MELELSRAELTELSREILAALLASAPAAGGDFADARRAGGWGFAESGFAASALLKGASGADSPDAAPREFLSLRREPGGAVFADGEAVSARERAVFGEGGGARTGSAASAGGAASIGERARLLEEYSERIRRDSRRYDAPLEKY